MLNSSPRDGAFVGPKAQHLIPENPLSDSGFDERLPVSQGDITGNLFIDLRFFDPVRVGPHNDINWDTFKH